MNANRIFKSNPEDIRHIMNIKGSFEARRPSHGVSGWGNINWASPQLTVIHHKADKSSEEHVYVSYDTYNEFREFYKPFSSSFAVYPEQQLVYEYADGEVIEHPFAEFTHNPVFTSEWGTWEHALRIYWEIFGRGLTAEEKKLVDTINRLTPDDFTKELRREVGKYLDDDRVIELCRDVLFKEDGTPNYYAHHVVCQNCPRIRDLRYTLGGAWEIWLAGSCNIRYA